MECGKYCPAFQQIIDDTGIERVPLPPRSPNLNAYAERWIRSVKEECLARVTLFGEASLRHVLNEYVEHYHQERNIIRVRAMSCSCRHSAQQIGMTARCSAANGLADCSNTTSERPHEFFDHTGWTGHHETSEAYHEPFRDSNASGSAACSG